MFKKIFSITILILTLFFEFCFWPNSVLAVGADEAGASATTRFQKESENFLGLREIKLRLFLESKDSPLAPYADDFIYFADQFAIDWRLLPAISGLESSFGKAILPGSYNAYGWGNGQIRFSSWSESIETVSRALAEKYYQRGLDTVEKIAPVYAPPSQDWAVRVKVIMEKIDSFGFFPQPKF